MKRVKSYLMKMTSEEKKAVEERAKEMGMSLAGYLRMLARLEMETKLKTSPPEKNQ